MANIEAIRDLLRTNSISKVLTVNARNSYVVALRELLTDLGFNSNTSGGGFGNGDYFSQDLSNTVQIFAQKNNLDTRGQALTPFVAATMVERYENLPNLKNLESAVSNGQYAQFNLQNPNDRNNISLRNLLENLNFTGNTTQDALRNYAQRKRLPGDGYQLTETLAKALLADIYLIYGDNLQKIPLRPGNNNGGSTANNGSNGGWNGNNPGNNGGNNTGNNGGWNTNPGNNTALNNNLQINDQAGTIVISDGSRQVQFRKHQPVGVSTPGFNSLITFVEQNKERLVELDLTYSALQVIEAIAKNEGRMDAINTYDRGILSIGTYQWTLGRDERAGELPALLKKYRDQFPDTFRRHFEPLGVNVSNDTNTTYGFLTLNNTPVNTIQAKEQFRDPAWAFRFWRALQEPDFQAVQVEHALDRLKNFYWKPNYAVFGNLLSTVITSAYGVALLLDNHVNRPAWIKNCVELAMQQTGLTNPTSFTDQNERDLIAAYLNVRHTFTDGSIPPMTKSQIRAQAIYDEVRAGRLSEARGSFQLSNKAVMAYDTARGMEKTAFPPVFYEPREFPDIENERL